MVVTCSSHNDSGDVIAAALTKSYSSLGDDLFGQILGLCEITSDAASTKDAVKIVLGKLLHDVESERISSERMEGLQSVLNSWWNANKPNETSGGFIATSPVASETVVSLIRNILSDVSQWAGFHRELNIFKDEVEDKEHIVSSVVSLLNSCAEDDIQRVVDVLKNTKRYINDTLHKEYVGVDTNFIGDIVESVLRIIVNFMYTRKKCGASLPGGLSGEGGGQVVYEEEPCWNGEATELVERDQEVDQFFDDDQMLGIPIHGEFTAVEDERSNNERFEDTQMNAEFAAREDEITKTENCEDTQINAEFMAREDAESNYDDFEDVHSNVGCSSEEDERSHNHRIETEKSSDSEEQFFRKSTDDVLKDEETVSLGDTLTEMKRIVPKKRRQRRERFNSLTNDYSLQFESRNLRMSRKFPGRRSYNRDINARASRSTTFELGDVIAQTLLKATKEHTNIETSAAKRDYLWNMTTIAIDSLIDKFEREEREDSDYRPEKDGIEIVKSVLIRLVTDAFSSYIHADAIHNIVDDCAAEIACLFYKPFHADHPWHDSDNDVSIDCFSDKSWTTNSVVNEAVASTIRAITREIKRGLLEQSRIACSRERNASTNNVNEATIPMRTRRLNDRTYPSDRIRLLNRCRNEQNLLDGVDRKWLKESLTPTPEECQRELMMSIENILKHIQKKQAVKPHRGRSGRVYAEKLRKDLKLPLPTRVVSNSHFCGHPDNKTTKGVILDQTKSNCHGIVINGKTSNNETKMLTSNVDLSTRHNRVKRWKQNKGEFTDDQSIKIGQDVHTESLWNSGVAAGEIGESSSTKIVEEVTSQRRKELKEVEEMARQTLRRAIKKEHRGGLTTDDLTEIVSRIKNRASNKSASVHHDNTTAGMTNDKDQSVTSVHLQPEIDGYTKSNRDEAASCASKIAKDSEICALQLRNATSTCTDLLQKDTEFVRQMRQQASVDLSTKTAGTSPLGLLTALMGERSQAPNSASVTMSQLGNPNTIYLLTTQSGPAADISKNGCTQTVVLGDTSSTSGGVSGGCEDVGSINRVHVNSGGLLLGHKKRAVILDPQTTTDVPSSPSFVEKRQNKSSSKSSDIADVASKEFRNANTNVGKSPSISAKAKQRTNISERIAEKSDSYASEDGNSGAVTGDNNARLVVPRGATRKPVALLPPEMQNSDRHILKIDDDAGRVGEYEPTDLVRTTLPTTERISQTVIQSSNVGNGHEANGCISDEKTDVSEKCYRANQKERGRLMTDSQKTAINPNLDDTRSDAIRSQNISENHARQESSIVVHDQQFETLSTPEVSNEAREECINDGNSVAVRSEKNGGTHNVRRKIVEHPTEEQRMKVVEDLMALAGILPKNRQPSKKCDVSARFVDSALNPVSNKPKPTSTALLNGLSLRRPSNKRNPKRLKGATKNLSEVEVHATCRGDSAMKQKNGKRGKKTKSTTNTSVDNRKVKIDAMQKID